MKVDSFVKERRKGMRWLVWTLTEGKDPLSSVLPVPHSSRPQWTSSINMCLMHKQTYDWRNYNDSFPDCSHSPYLGGGVCIWHLWMPNKLTQNLVALDSISGGSLAASGQFFWLSLAHLLQLDSSWDGVSGSSTWLRGCQGRSLSRWSQGLSSLYGLSSQVAELLTWWLRALKAQGGGFQVFQGLRPQTVSMPLPPPSCS